MSGVSPDDCRVLPGEPFMNTPQIAKDLYDEANKSQPFITGRSVGDPDPSKQEFSVVCTFRTLKESQEFHTKLTRFVSPFVRDELLTSAKLAFPNKAIVPTKTLTFDDTQSAEFTGAPDLLAALEPVAREIIHGTPDVFEDNWNPDAHAEHVTLTIRECRAILRAFQMRAATTE